MRKLGAQMRIGLAHPDHGLFDGRVFARFALGEREHIANPMLHALMSWSFTEHRAGRSEALDRDDGFDRFGEDTRALQDDTGAERMADENGGLLRERVE